MKIKILSDIHLEHYNACQVFPWIGEGDILILAGDILCAKNLKKNGYLKSVYLRFLEDCSKNYEKVLYVKGNHESWGCEYGDVDKTIRKFLPNNVHLLENDAVIIDNFTFVCATFWTNFRNANPIEMLDAEMYMNDYKQIKFKVNGIYRKLRAQDTLNFHNQSRDYLLNQLETLKDNVFIITHHAPSYQSVSENFRTTSCNSAFCNDYDGLILNNPQIKYWVHGHTHTHFNYKIGECNVICNPCGYPGQNTKFNPNFILNI